MFRGRVTMAIMVLIALGLLAFSACSQQGAIKATWIKAEVTGNTVSIPLSVVNKDIITHFKISTPTDDLAFMVYKFGDKLYARANICPPCLSENFSLKNNTLVCDTCGTVFDARTGAGISGACVAYPKAPVSYELKDGNVLMKGTDLVTAFQDTLRPKRT